MSGDLHASCTRSCHLKDGSLATIRSVHRSFDLDGREAHSHLNVFEDVFFAGKSLGGYDDSGGRVQEHSQPLH